MTFLHPWAVVLGSLAAALPIAIHWLTRPRPVRMPLSTIRFVHEALRQRRARNRLRDLLVLLLRTLAVLLIAWVIGRPLLGRNAAAGEDEAGDTARVVLLDVSHSLAAETHGIQIFERGRPVAAAHLKEQSGLQANLILAGASARPVFDRFSSNLAALRDEVARARPRQERLQLAAAISQAGQLLGSTSPGKRRELVIVSDFQRSNWANADFSPLPMDTHIQLESVAPAEPLANFAILRVGSQGRVEQNRPGRLEVEVGNYSNAARRVQVEAVLGEAIYHLEGNCPTGTSTLTTEIIVRSAGWMAGEARLVGVQDSLPADNSRPFVIEVRPPPVYALITRQSATLRPSSSYYLERALVPLAPRSGQSQERVVRLDPANLDREALNAADAVVLDHPGKLPRETVQQLVGLLRRGRGILYVTAEPADAGNLNLLAELAGSELQMPVEFTAPTAGQRRRDLFFADVRSDLPPFSIFSDKLTAVTGTLRFSGGLASRPRTGALLEDVRATLSDQSAGLVVTSCGAGSLAILNLDLIASNLPGSPAFVPLLGELITRLMERRRAAESWSSGEPLAVFVPSSGSSAQGLEIIGPNGSAGEHGKLQEEAGGVWWRWPAAGTPGVYYVKRDGRTIFALAVTCPPEESDLKTLVAAVFKNRLSGGRSVQFHEAAADDAANDSLWSWLALVCVCCLLGEVLALKLFGG